jgi:3-deoxy-D-manno-octulosonic-acid transferase
MLAFLLYNTLLVFALPFYFWKLIRREKNKPSIGSRWKEYFGFVPKLDSNQSPIWIHAVSVGEVRTAVPLIKALYKKSPSTPILVTTTTTTGAEQVSIHLAGIVQHRYMPLDIPWFIKRFIKRIKPRELLIVETELWPNMLTIAKKSGCSISLLNARLSPRSFARYQKVHRFFFKSIAVNLTRVLCQYPSDASFFVQLGIKPENVHITGSLKFDLSIEHSVKLQGKLLRESFGPERKVWVAASTHSGEESQVLDAHSMVMKKWPNALLILVPRHPQRFEEVYDLCLESGFETAKRSTGDPIHGSTSVYLCDAMGELLQMLAASDVCFMAGSLVGEKVGGHNVLEPAALDICTVTGPSYFNFKDIVEALADENGIVICDSNQNLGTNLTDLLGDSSKRKAIAGNAAHILKNGQGAVDRTVSFVTVEWAAGTVDY